jgi:hypothetical protein
MNRRCPGKLITNDKSQDAADVLVCMHCGETFGNKYSIGQQCPRDLERAVKNKAA